MTKMRAIVTTETEMDFQSVDDYVWCDNHGTVHEAQSDPYNMGKDCRDDWRELWIKGDYDYVERER